jgi:thiol-disulfide isomerase/thioredoxin
MKLLAFPVLLAAFVGCTVAQEAKKDDPAASPDAQFKALQKDYQTTTRKYQADMQAAEDADARKKIDDVFQRKHEEMCGKFLALAKANPKADFCLSALALATRDDTTDKAAIAFAVETFGEDKKILGFLPIIMGRPDAAPTMAKLKNAKSPEIRCSIGLMEIQSELEALDQAEPPKPAAELEKGYAAIGTKLEALLKDSADVDVVTPNGPAKLADAVKGVKFFLEHLVVGKTLADVSTPTLDDDKKAKISDYRGKVVVLDIWATWCGPCRAMIPHERAMVAKLKDKPFALISVSADDKKKTLSDFLEKTPMPWVHWHSGPQGELIEKYQVQFFPTVYVLDAKGVIRFKHLRGEALEKAVETLLEETK